MFSRKSTAERTADQAWDYLSAAVAAAGESARSQTARLSEQRAHLAEVAGERSSRIADRAAKRSAQLAGRSHKLADKAGKRGAALADQVGNRAGSVADEAWQRANAAANALAGKRPGLPWGLIIGVGVLGVTLGWVAAATARAAIARQAENDELELAETTAAPTRTFDN
jgi:hypothetical protein